MMHEPAGAEIGRESWLIKTTRGRVGRVALAVLVAATIASLIFSLNPLVTAQGEQPLVAVAPRQQAEDAVRVAYLYRDAQDQAFAITGLLNDNGLLAESISLAEGDMYRVYLPLVVSYAQATQSFSRSTVPTSASASQSRPAATLPDLSGYDLIIIGADTGSGANWMPGQPGLAAAIADAGLPIVGMGPGGYAFFGQLELAIGHPYANVTTAQSVAVADFGESQAIYETPTPIAIPSDRTLTLFNSPQTAYSLELEGPPRGGIRIAQVVGGYPIATADGDKLLWGFDASLDALTGTGRTLLLNAIWYQVGVLGIPLPSGDIIPTPGIEPELIDALNSTEGAGLHVLAQLNSLPTPEEQQALADAGVTLINHLHGTAYRVNVAPDFDQAAVEPLVRWAGLLRAADRVASKVAAGDFETWAENEDGTVNLIVTLYRDVPPDEMEVLLNRYDPAATPYGSQRFAMRVLPEEINALAAEDRVLWIEEGPAPMQVTNDRAREDHLVNEVQNLDLSQGLVDYRGLSGRDLNVGIFDTGVTSSTFTHPALDGRLLRTDYDNDGHGTHVAGIVAGSGADSSNLRLRGMAPEANLIPYSTNWDASIMREALRTYDMDVSNHSYVHNCGGYGNKSADVDELVRGDMVFRTTGDLSITDPLPTHFYVSAAGNQGTSAQYCRTGTLPGGGSDPTSGLRGYYAVTNPAKNAVVVGALVPSSNYDLGSYSSRGPTWDGRIKPDVVANGTMFSTRHVPDASGGTYVSKSGTSMASPAVAGIATLMLEQYEASFPTAGQPMPALLRALLVHTAIDLTHAPGAPGFQEYGWNDPDTGQPVIYHAGPDWATGYGAVNADRAVAAVEAGAFRTGTVSPENRTVEYTFYVPAERTELKFTLAWDDEPGDATTATRLNTPELVNDLDLELEASDGTIYYPWILNRPPRHSSYVNNNPWRETGAQDPISRTLDIQPAFQGIDRRNNLEQVQVTDPAGLPAGTWRLRVHAYRLPNNQAQPFALAGDLAMSLNTQPTVRIWSPDAGDGFSNGDDIDLLATAEDMEEADANLTVEWWTEDAEGVPYLLGNSPNGATLTIQADALPGCGGDNVPLTARALDDDGATRDKTLVIRANLNDPADISIEAPSEGQSFVEGQTIQLRAQGTDLRCPNSFDPDQMEWHLSSRFGTLLGTGSEVDITLPAGTHDIVLYYDDAGIDVVDQRQITVAEAPTRTVMERVLYFSEIPLSGEVTDGGSVLQNDVIVVGDDAANAVHRGFVAFDLSPLPDDLTRIITADLTIDILEEVNNPYNDLLELRAYHVDYGPTLDAGDFTPSFLPGVSTIANGPGNTGFQTVDATVSAQDAWTNRGTYGDRLQFLFQFRTATDDDGTAEQVRISNQESFNLLQPAIEIWYEIEETLDPPRTTILQPEDGETITDYSNQPYAAVDLWGYGLGPDGFLPDSALTWEYREVGTDNTWSLAGTGERLTVQLQDQYCNSATQYEIRLTADDGTLPPGYAYVRIAINALIC